MPQNNLGCTGAEAQICLVANPKKILQVSRSGHANVPDDAGTARAEDTHSLVEVCESLEGYYTNEVVARFAFQGLVRFTNFLISMINVS